MIILLGAPGSGKGTQASRICEVLGAKVFTMGDALRGEIASGSILGTEMKSYLDKGELVPDSVILSIFTNNIKGFEPNNTILDGFPRTVNQALFLTKYLNSINSHITVILLEVSDSILIDRMLARKRSDDTKSVIQTRLKMYHSETKPLIDFYSKRINVIDGTGSEQDVFDRIKMYL